MKEQTEKDNFLKEALYQGIEYLCLAVGAVALLVANLISKDTEEDDSWG